MKDFCENFKSKVSRQVGVRLILCRDNLQEADQKHDGGGSV